MNYNALKPFTDVNVQTDKIHVELGCGENRRDMNGYKNIGIDIVDGKCVDKVCNLGFEDIDDVDPTTTLELTLEDLRQGSDAVLLKFVQYQRVKSITLFIEDNNGGDVSALGGLKFFGKPVANTNMKEFKKQG